MRTRLLTALLLAPTLALAHWTDQPHLPDWALRGRLHWCLHYSRANRALVDLFLDGGQTFVHGGSFDSPETAAYAAEHGLRYMPYVCSRTTTTQEIDAHPELREAVLLQPDGTEFLAYGNPVRRYGCLFTPPWPEWVRERTRRVMDLPDTAAVFYDNVYVNDDHRPAAIQAWQKWATDHGLPPGDDMPSTRQGDLAAASRAFNSEALVDYYRGLHQFNQRHDPPLLISPNLGSLPGYGMAIVEANAADLVFYETMSHPPFEPNAWRYKLGLACSHGRPTGLLAYLPERIGTERGEKTWHEGMHHFFYPSSPLPQEFSLAIAEAAACDGTYIPAYNLFPSLPVTDLTDPFCQRIHHAIKQSYSFLRADEELATAAQPGSNVALLYSSSTTTQSRLLQNLPALCDALSAAGIPYEIVNTQDVAGAGLGGIERLIVPSLQYADEATADGLLRWVQNGGTAILSGPFATNDDLGRPASYASARALAEALRLTDVAIRQWQLDGFEPEGEGLVKAVEQGAQATLAFGGQAGRYRAYLGLLDENDGTSPFRLRVDGQVVFEGTLDVEDNGVHWPATPPFDLKPGSTVTLEVDPHGGEMGRVQGIVLCAADGAAGVKLGRGEVTWSPVGLERRSAPELVALLRPKARLVEPGQVFVNLLDVPARRLTEVHLVNYDFRYDVAHPGRYATDDGSAEARTYFSGRPVVLRKVLLFDRPDKVTEPVLQVQAYATEGCTAALVVTIDGQPAGRIPTANARGWLELPFDANLLRADTVIELRAEGDLDQNRWCQIGIDTDAPGGGSFYSEDGGTTFSSADLSADLKAQTGELLIRIVDRQPEGAPDDPANLVRNPGFEHVRVPHSETQLTVVPATSLGVEVAGAPAGEGLVISPEAAPQWLKAERRGEVTLWRVPAVSVYSVLLLSPDHAALEQVRQAQLAAAPWDLPPVTTPLRSEVTGWNAYEAGFSPTMEGAHSGVRCLTIANDDANDVRGAVQQLELEQTAATPLIITAWSRAENVSGPPDGHYSVYVDATCTDGTVYNGHNTPFAVGTHDWQQATLRLEPPAPLKTLRLYLLFRKHTGRVWFDDVTLHAAK